MKRNGMVILKSKVGEKMVMWWFKKELVLFKV